MKFVRAKTISGPKTLLWQPTGQTPKTHIYFYYGFPWVNYVFFLRVNYGFLKASVLFKIRTYGFSMGMYGVNTG